MRIEHAFCTWLIGCAVLIGAAPAHAADQPLSVTYGLWVAIGLAVAIAGAILFALRISRPILAIGRVATEVATGDFRARVEGVRAQDEIGELARRMNDMIVGLNERFHLAKFVSTGTLTAIQSSGHRGIRLGGERRRAAILFCDIRGYTAFSERHDPETVVEVLNYYFQRLADRVVHHKGDIDKFVGDQIVAVFQEEAMELDAVRCALDMHRTVVELAGERPDWDLAVGIGINAGEVIMGAMGSEQRMDYTVLGDHVNLTARLCAHAGRGQTLISESVHAALGDAQEIVAVALAPITVKGKSSPIPVYEVRSGPARDVSLATDAA